MEKQERRLGELELDVLKIVWQHQPCTVQEIAEILAERRGLARTTILTIMQRLSAKGFLKRRKRGGIYHYSATEDRDTILSRLTRQFVATVLDESPLPFIAYLSETKGLTPDQAAALRRIIDDVEAEAGEDKS